MITPETFSKNEVLRSKLAMSMDIVDIAFHAADNAEDRAVLVDESNPLANACRHAGRAAIIRYKNLIRSMAAIPSEAPSPLLDNYLGIDAYEQIAIDAESEAREQTFKAKNKTRK